MFEIQVHPHALKHGLSEETILEAWDRSIRMRHRREPNCGQIASIGVDRKGRLIEMVAAERPYGVLIYHAVTPPTDKLLMELGWDRR